MEVHFFVYVYWICRYVTLFLRIRKHTLLYHTSKCCLISEQSALSCLELITPRTKCV
jgi:hypothetical protein